MGALTFGILLTLGGPWLLVGSDVARVVLALTYLFGARTKATQFALGMAEGRKAAALAAAPEYVAGRAVPRALDWTGGIVFAALGHVLPATLLLISLRLS